MRFAGKKKRTSVDLVEDGAIDGQVLAFDSEFALGLDWERIRVDRFFVKACVRAEDLEHFVGEERYVGLNKDLASGGEFSPIASAISRFTIRRFSCFFLNHGSGNWIATC